MSRASYIYELVEKGIRECGSRNPFALTESLGIFLSYRNLGGLKGFYWEIENEQHIVLHEKMSDPMTVLICAHELGHACLHRHLATHAPLIDQGFLTQTSRIEHEANRFAAELLLPDSAVTQALEGIHSLSDLAAQLQQPEGLILFKLRQMVARGYDIPLPEEENAQFLAQIQDF